MEPQQEVARCLRAVYFIKSPSTKLPYIVDPLINALLKTLLHEAFIEANSLSKFTKCYVNKTFPFISRNITCLNSMHITVPALLLII